jgi:hypothetical protein
MYETWLERLEQDKKKTPLIFDYHAVCELVGLKLKHRIPVKLTGALLRQTLSSRFSV